MMDREERSVICTYSTNLSSQTSALGIATAFSKGMQSTLLTTLIKPYIFIEIKIEDKYPVLFNFQNTKN